MILKHISCYLLLSLLLVSFAWSQERAAHPAKKFVARQALVIGNADYDYAGRLRNPVNDAKAIGSTLKKLGFKVKVVTNANRRIMEAAIRQLGVQRLAMTHRLAAGINQLSSASTIP